MLVRRSLLPLLRLFYTPYVCSWEHTDDAMLISSHSFLGVSTAAVIEGLQQAERTPLSRIESHFRLLQKLTVNVNLHTA